MNILPSSLISNNATLKAFDIDGLLHPVKPIEQLTPIIFNNLESKKIHRFSLDTNYYLALKHITCIDKEFQDAVLVHPDDMPGTNNYEIVFKQIKDNKVKDYFIINLNVDDSNDLPSVVFTPQSSWQIYLNEMNCNLTKLVLYCEPFVTFSPLEFNFSSLTEVVI